MNNTEMVEKITEIAVRNCDIALLKNLHLIKPMHDLGLNPIELKIQMVRGAAELILEMSIAMAEKVEEMGGRAPEIDYDEWDRTVQEYVVWKLERIIAEKSS